MNRGEFQSSLVQQMIWSGSSTGTATGGGAGNLMGSLKPCHEDQEASPNMPSLSSPSLIFSQQFQHSSPGLVPMNSGAGASAASLPSLHDGGGGHESSMPESWSQLLLGGLAGDQERYRATAALLSKGLENWGDHASACMVGGMKEEGSMAQAAATAAAYSFYGSHLAGDHQHEIQAAAAAGGGGASNKSQLSQMLMASSPRSCITTSLGSNMLDFSNTAAPPELRSHHHNSDNSSEVRKERLGDRITALHQIVSPFGKGANDDGKKDLRSRGLCLVPVSCTSHFGGDNAADYWAPAPLGGILR
uniref:BHLH domain-containing protein n=1 Tax=Oryza meridionalis TaxID=40149 RepID=A0A0E0DNI8_9ORYZ